jgi:DNA-directed RNA polymerase specialized sigma24 family protein
MKTSDVNRSSARQFDHTVDELLAQYDSYIIALACRNVPRNVIPVDKLNDEIDELAQRIRIKFWQIARKKHITVPLAYIRCIAYTEVVDMVRRYRSAPLSLYEDAEGYHGHTTMVSEGWQDVAEKLEQEEMTEEAMSMIVDEIFRLPARQLQALLYSLRDQIEDFLPLVEALKDRKMEVGEISWPDEREEVQRLRASLSVARKKLRSLKDDRC